jgi:hypothetical protein
VFVFLAAKDNKTRDYKKAFPKEIPAVCE